MGVDPKWGRFPICPRNGPFFPRLSSFLIPRAPVIVSKSGGERDRERERERERKKKSRQNGPRQI